MSDVPELIEEIRAASRQIAELRAGLGRMAGDFAEINLGLVRWFQRGRELQQQLVDAQASVLEAQREYADVCQRLREKLAELEDPADWWKDDG